MNNTTREIKQKINGTREHYSEYINSKKYNCSLKLFPSAHGVYATFTGENVAAPTSFSICGYFVTYEQLKICDVPQISRLFDTEDGRQHLSRYLLGLESCLVKD